MTMAITVTWEIPTVEFDLQLDGKTNVITSANWIARGEDENGNTGFRQGYAEFNTEELSNFTPYEDVTEEQVLQWVFDVLGAENVNKIDQNVKDMINAAANPTQGQGVPWAS
jgi:hypothetical protein